MVRSRFETEHYQLTTSTSTTFPPFIPSTIILSRCLFTFVLRVTVFGTEPTDGTA